MKIQVVRVDNNPNIEVYEGVAEAIIDDLFYSFTVPIGPVMELDWKEYTSANTETWDERFEAAETSAEVFKILREATT